jgi:hypothetical protein
MVAQSWVQASGTSTRRRATATGSVSIASATRCAVSTAPRQSSRRRSAGF